jgi:VWFA-related protein
MQSKLTRLSALMLLLLLPFAITAQEAAPLNSTTTLHVKARIVVLDVVVTNQKGDIITNLSKDDFIVREDKVPQRIVSFEAPAQHQLPQTKTPLVHSSADLKNIGDAPVTILVIDELNTQFMDEAYGRQQLLKYLDNQPEVLKQPTMLLAVTDTKFTMLHDYTQDRSSLLEIAHKHLPQLPGKVMRGDTEAQLAQSLVALIQIAQASTGYSGRKNVVWLGKGFPGVSMMDTDPDTLVKLEAVTRSVTNTLLAARVTLYGIDPMGLSSVAPSASFDPDGNVTGVSDDINPFADEISFAGLTTATGGAYFYNNNDVEHEIASSVDRGAQYYTLSYTPTSASDDPTKYRNISIRMKNPKLLATTRSGYYPESLHEQEDFLITKDLSEKQARARLEMDMSNAAYSTMSYSGMKISATRGTSNVWNISLPPGTLAWKDEADGTHHVAQITVMVASFNAKGKALSHITHEFTSRTGSEPPRLNDPDKVFQVPFDVPPGTVRLRVIVRDATSGRIGTADVDKP